MPKVTICYDPEKVLRGILMRLSGEIPGVICGAFCPLEPDSSLVEGLIELHFHEKGSFDRMGGADLSIVVEIGDTHQRSEWLASYRDALEKGLRTLGLDKLVGRAQLQLRNRVKISMIPPDQAP